MGAVFAFVLGAMAGFSDSFIGVGAGVFMLRSCASSSVKKSFMGREKGI